MQAISPIQVYLYYRRAEQMPRWPPGNLNFIQLQRVVKLNRKKQPQRFLRVSSSVEGQRRLVTAVPLFIGISSILLIQMG